LWFIASPIYWLLTFINSFVGNYGFSILLLTVCVKGIFYKLSATSYRSMANMRRVMPKMNQLKERFGDDKMRLQKETMELYKKEKINPFGGCLPILVQMPVFIALYWVLLESVELRHAPFILWINDLSVMDPFFVLPILMGVSMYAQFMLSPTPQDPTQAKIMKFMPVVMTVFFLWFPAGLVLYWLTNSVLGIAQQWYITRGIEKEQARKDAARV
jgi:YidC/Oxa1 family membrane protein insertase